VRLGDPARPQFSNAWSMETAAFAASNSFSLVIGSTGIISKIGEDTKSHKILWC